MDYSKALCAQIVPDLYFPENPTESSSNNLLLTKKMCFDCALLEACFETALATPLREDFGVWGGTTANERRLMRELPSKLKLHREKIKYAITRQAKGEAA